MTAVKAPLRMAVMAVLETGEPLTAADISGRLALDYSGERQSAPGAVEDHLQALRAVGLVRRAAAYLAGERLIESYCITGRGRARLAWSRWGALAAGSGPMDKPCNAPGGES